jgi:DHA1 family multidrug resistance protein-like MFS transporter
MTYSKVDRGLIQFRSAFGLTSYTAGIPMITAEFKVNNTVSILGLSIYLLGIAFAPIYTPHVAERIGRSKIYLVSFFISTLFNLGATRSESIASLIVCRFFTGLFGGPSLVLIEGTFADIWSAETTNTYYAFLGAASYIGAASGPLVSGFVVTAGGWRWTGYISLMISLGALLFGIGIPETYSREITRRHAKHTGITIRLPPAESGVTLSQMFKITVITPAVMLISEPIVILTSLALLYNWAVLFQWFITVPVVLESAYSFTLSQAGLAFISAIVGTVCAAVTSIVIEQFLYRKAAKRQSPVQFDIEYRLLPAMIGSVMLPAALFWVGWSAGTKPWAVPVVGTAVYVYGSLLMLISLVPYLFDAYPPAGTLSALTVAAVMRILLGAAIPLCILPMFKNLTGAWALSVFGFIGIALIPIPFVLFKFGSRWRHGSRYASQEMMHDDMPGMDANGKSAMSHDQGTMGTNV